MLDAPWSSNARLEWTRSVWERRAAEEAAAQEAEAAEQQDEEEGCSGARANRAEERAELQEEEEEASGRAPPAGTLSILATGESSATHSSTSSRSSGSSNQHQRDVGSKYAFGPEPTFVDYHLLATLRALQWMYPMATATHLGLPELQRLKRWRARMVSRPRIAAFLETAPPVLRDGCVLHEAMREVGRV